MNDNNKENQPKAAGYMTRSRYLSATESTKRKQPMNNNNNNSPEKRRLKPRTESQINQQSNNNASLSQPAAKKAAIIKPSVESELKTSQEISNNQDQDQDQQQQQQQQYREEIQRLKTELALVNDELDLSYQKFLQEESSHHQTCELNSELTQERDNIRKELIKLNGELLLLKQGTSPDNAATASNEELATCVKQLEQQLKEKHHELEVLKARMAALESQLQKEKQENSALKARLLDLEQDIRVMEAERAKNDEIRRNMHNIIQDLKGNIRVMCRVRPPLSHEMHSAAVNFSTTITKDGKEKIAVTDSSDKKKKGSIWEFELDKIFETHSSQSDVFEEMSQLVQSALDGYRVCVFAYGQTGSGKTFTMEGQIADEVKRGMIPRAFEKLFQGSKVMQQHGWDIAFEASFVEIYNDNIRDLLSSTIDEGKSSKCVISHDAKGETSISNATVVAISDVAEIWDLLAKAASARSVAAMKLNQCSSRSHSAFLLKIKAKHSVTGKTRSGALNMIDLAGSERLASSGSIGDRLKETQHINKSLSALSTVITALQRKDNHIPYRNSQLTYLLQTCLGGDSKALMLCTLSPLLEHLPESISSLRFAATVNTCELAQCK